MNGVELVKMVTAFTLSHSLTLFLSATDLFMPPSQLIELLIAITILLSALNDKLEWIEPKKSG